MVWLVRSVVQVCNQWHTPALGHSSACPHVTKNVARSRYHALSVNKALTEKMWYILSFSPWIVQ